MSQTASTPAAKAAPDKSELELLDDKGNATGITVKLTTADPALEGFEAAASRVTSWSAMELDGEKHTFSKEKARALLARFPHFAAQIKKA